MVAGSSRFLGTFVRVSGLEQKKKIVEREPITSVCSCKATNVDCVIGESSEKYENFGTTSHR